jgi:hypothetical protein
MSSPQPEEGDVLGVSPNAPPKLCPAISKHLDFREQAARINSGLTSVAFGICSEPSQKINWTIYKLV